jgi:CRISPR-associated protein Csc1
MPEVYDLDHHGLRLFKGWLYNHDYLWFSSTESGQISTTLPVLHNYALSYALSGYSWTVSPASPQYRTDLAQMRLYVTPAELSTPASRTTLTFNALDDLTLRTDSGPNVNTPSLGRRIYLDPIFAPPNTSRTAERAMPCYTIYAFVFSGSAPPGVFRLGKKGAPVRAYWRELIHPRAVFQDEPQRLSHLLNPLDLAGSAIRYEIVAIPPHLLLRSAIVAHDWFIQAEGQVIHLPRHVRERANA